MTKAVDDLPPLREIISAHNLRAEKKLGQNFLLDLNLTGRIARSAGSLKGKTAFEIGPGPGGLTRALLGTEADKVIAIEYDPRAIEAARRSHPELAVEYAASAREAMRGAGAVVLLTEWTEFRELDPVEERAVVRTPLMIDGRNVLDRERWVAAGWRFRALGRGAGAASR